jgi:hypothetical protein
MTKKDVLNQNVDLINHAVTILKGAEAYTLSARLSPTATGAYTVIASTKNLDRLDGFVDGRPQVTLDVVDGENVFQLPAFAGRPQLELRGFKQGRLAASTRLTLLSTSLASVA